MANFDDAVTILLKNEGGYSPAHPSDPGGETNLGITKRSYPSLDIKALSVAQAKEIYRRDFWLPAKCDDLPWPICAAHLDAAANMGIHAAAVVLQRAVGAVEDGLVGANTVMLVRTKSAPIVLSNVLLERMLYYARIARDKPFELPNLPGWIIRCGNLRRALVKV